MKSLKDLNVGDLAVVRMHREYHLAIITHKTKTNRTALILGTAWKNKYDVESGLNCELNCDGKLMLFEDLRTFSSVNKGFIEQLTDLINDARHACTNQIIDK